LYQEKVFKKRVFTLLANFEKVQTIYLQLRVLKLNKILRKFCKMLQLSSSKSWWCFHAI